MYASNGKKLTSPPQLLKYWIEERETIRRLKDLNHPKPWSEDPVFQTTYFTNIYREADKVTRWLRSDWLVDDSNYEFAMVVARLVNKTETLAFIDYPYAGVPFDRFLDKVVRAGKTLRPFWGNAYLVSTHGQRMDKVQYLIGLLEAAHKALPLVGVAGTCAAYHAAFKKLEGFSDFMAGQVVADLKNTAFHPLAKAPDWYTFVAPGPGSKKGVNYFFGVYPETPISTNEFLENIKEIRSTLEDLSCRYIHTMCNQDLQNCLCEFSKYMRISRNEGRSKRKYNGR